MLRIHSFFRSIGQLFATIILLVAMTVPEAQARTFKQTVASGKTTLVNWHHRIREDCKIQPISLDIVKQPKNGVVTAKLSKRKLDRKTAGNLRHCYGKTAVFIEVYYKSKKGFKGKDSFSYKRVSPQKNDKWNRRTVKMKITVE